MILYNPCTKAYEDYTNQMILSTTSLLNSKLKRNVKTIRHVQPCLHNDYYINNFITDTCSTYHNCVCNCIAILGNIELTNDHQCYQLTPNKVTMACQKPDTINTALLQY